MVQMMCGAQLRYQNEDMVQEAYHFCREVANHRDMHKDSKSGFVWGWSHELKHELEVSNRAFLGKNIPPGHEALEAQIIRLQKQLKDWEQEGRDSEERYNKLWGKKERWKRKYTQLLDALISNSQAQILVLTKDGK